MAKKNKDVFLMGKYIYLRALVREDLESNWYKWFNDPSVTDLMYKGVFPNTYEGQVKFFENMINSTNMIQLGIIEAETDKLIGVVSLSNINWVNRIGEIAIVIGEEKFRGKRNGLEAMALMMFHGFTKMNLNRIWAGQHIGLKTWKEALEDHLCFKTEGKFREAIFSHGKYHDVVIIGTLAKDFLKKLKDNDNDIIKMIENK